MQILLLIIFSSISVALLISSLVLSKKEKLRTDWYLFIYLAYFIVSQSFYAIDQLGLLKNTPWPLYIRGFYLGCTPLFLLYLYSVTHHKKKIPKPLFLLFIPFIAFSMTFVTYYLKGFQELNMEVIFGLIYVDDEISVVWLIFSLALLLIDPICLFIFFILLKDYRKRLKQSTSNTDYVNLNWLNLLLVIWSISVFILIPFHAITVGTPFLSTDLIEILVQIANLVFIFIFGWYGLKQNIIYQFEQPITASRDSYARSGLSNESALQLKDQLLTYMQDQKPYLNNELKAHEMAGQLNISTTHLSQVLNKHLGKSFFEFVNEYRVNEVIRKMKSKEHQHYTLLAMALESGFNSKTTFNALFKKYTGRTPSSYFKSLK